MVLSKCQRENIMMIIMTISDQIFEHIIFMSRKVAKIEARSDEAGVRAEDRENFYFSHVKPLEMASPGHFRGAYRGERV